jgi:hypothetical protein
MEQKPGQFVLAGDVHEGTVLLTAGLDRNWQEKRVEITSGWLSDSALQMYILVYEMPGESMPRQIICTPDHLFLMKENVLQNVQSLVPGDQLRLAHGEELATVALVYSGEYMGGVRAIQMGDFDGKNLDGHLLSTNGLVTADYAVQVAYHADAVAAHLLAPEEKETCRQAAYLANAQASSLHAFLNNDENWPKGFRPRPNRMINPPKTAKRYVSDQQAKDIAKNSDPSDPRSLYPSDPVVYLFQLYQGFFPEVIFILDWGNDDANAYTWTDFRKKMIVVSGGLARAKGIERDGMALILAVMLAFDEETTCIGPADYRGVEFCLRYAFDGELFFKVFHNAIGQIQTLFGYIDPKHRGENPKNLCTQPSVECRLETYQAALSMLDIPACAVPPPDGLAVTGAVVSAADVVQVTFNLAVDPPAAQTLGNYTVAPHRAVVQAEVDPGLPAVVSVHVGEAFEPGKDYEISVKHVVSDSQKPLDPKHTKAKFRAPEAGGVSAQGKKK